MGLRAVKVNAAPWVSIELTSIPIKRQARAHMLNLTLRQLRIFQAAAGDLSFARAAKQLHLSQPAISMQIRHMEDSLGFPLFERDGRHVSLSEAGRAIYECSLGITSNFVELEWLAEQYRTADRGHVRIAALTTADYVLSDLLAKYLQQRPNVTLTLRSGNGAEVMRLLEDNMVDFAIVGNPQPSGMNSLEPLFDNAFVTVARSGYVKITSKKLPISFLEHQQLIVREATSSGRIAVEEFLCKHGIKPTIRMSLSSDEAIKNAVRAGVGIAILPLVTVLHEIRWRELEVLRIDEFPLMRKWHLAIRNGKKLSASADALRRLLIRGLPEVCRAQMSVIAKPAGKRGSTKKRFKDC